MADPGQLRATSDMMLEQVDRLRAAEEAKRELRPGTREFSDLAFEVLQISREVVRWSEIQLQQANEIQAARPPASDPLVETPKKRLDELLAEWRQAEMRLSMAPPASDELREATEAVERLRAEYARLQQSKMDARG